MHKMDPPPCAVETPEDVATIMDMGLAAKEAEEREVLWRSQKPAFAVVTALALGLRRLRAEVRRRVDAWKTIAASAASIPPTTDALTVAPSPHQSQRDEPHTPRRRNSFHTSFNRWATSTGVPFIRSLGRAITLMETTIERTRSTILCALHISGAKLTDALLNLGVPFATSYGPSWRPGYPDRQHARKMFHILCNCDPETDQPVETGFSRCRQETHVVG